ncbi:hypothetical protein HGM15179_010428 [Zosterops borbonicus]|uniref:Uncharacterized protein n=1 Tax=Zosterops borbonicus TaxID=364589 RepID=A0A8K1LJP1_9PASS|nr:hypothetical protein HGM15179_010428 [Zosterops borbonicus]
MGLVVEVLAHPELHHRDGGGEAGIPLDHFTSPWDRNELLEVEEMEVEVEEVEEVETPVEAPVEAPVGFELLSGHAHTCPSCSTPIFTPP